jgi:Protein of unknown function (DUF1573)
MRVPTDLAAALCTWVLLAAYVVWPTTRDREQTLAYPDGRLLDFGALPLGQHRAKLRMRNDGKTPLRVQSVRSSCGCLRVIGGSYVVQPGEYVTCLLEADVSSVDPRTVFVFVLHDNGSDVVRVRFEGQGAGRAIATPRTLFYDDLLPGERCKGTIAVVVPTHGTVCDCRVEPANILTVTDIQPRHGGPQEGTTYLVQFDAVAPFLPGIAATGYVDVVCDRPQSYRCRVPFRLGGRHDVVVDPRELWVSLSAVDEWPKRLGVVRYALPVGGALEEVETPAWMACTHSDTGSVALSARRLPETMPTVGAVVIRFRLGTRQGTIRIPIAVEKRS